MKKSIKITFALVIAAIILLFVASLGEPSVESQYIVNFSTHELLVYISGQEKAKYLTCLPAKKIHLPIRGIVDKAELDPLWFPGPIARHRYQKKHKKPMRRVIPRGDPENEMGVYKITPKFAPGSKISSGSRVHTTKHVDSIRKNSSIACVRLLDKDGLDLSRYVKEKVTTFTYVADMGRDVKILYYGILKDNVDIAKNSIGVPKTKLRWQNENYIGFIYEAMKELRDVRFVFVNSTGRTGSGELFTLQKSDIRDVGFLLEDSDRGKECQIIMYSGDKKIYSKTWKITR